MNLEEHLAEDRKQWEQIALALGDLYDLINNMRNPALRRYAAQAVASSPNCAEFSPEEMQAISMVGPSVPEIIRFAGQAQGVFMQKVGALAGMVQIGDLLLDDAVCEARRLEGPSHD